MWGEKASALAVILCSAKLHRPRGSAERGERHNGQILRLGTTVKLHRIRQPPKLGLWVQQSPINSQKTQRKYPHTPRWRSSFLWSCSLEWWVRNRVDNKQGRIPLKSCISMLYSQAWRWKCNAVVMLCCFLVRVSCCNWGKCEFQRILKDKDTGLRSSLEQLDLNQPLQSGGFMSWIYI